MAKFNASFFKFACSKRENETSWNTLALIEKFGTNKVRNSKERLFTFFSSTKEDLNELLFNRAIYV